MRSGSVSSTVSATASAALRRGSPSSTLCLKGPRSTTRSSRSSTVSQTTGSTSGPTSSATSRGWWCAAAFTSSRQARRTSRSSSRSMARNCGISGASSAVHRSPAPPPPPPPPWLTQYLSAVTIVHRMNASPAPSAASFSSPGSSFSGCMAASAPRHSATMLRTPSSGVSQCRYMCGSTSSTWAEKSREGSAAWQTMTSLSAASSRYWWRDSPRAARMPGR
mmetsp:Transcript_15534/g.29158  ORF Transcript_15534/g.29158 Transcript_15534/m.29158 type:complete len:221 (+) Transcript_15534:212-874(+)